MKSQPGRRARLARDRRGSVALEFAAAGVTILILFFAIFDIGFLFLDQRGLDFGVNQAARWGTVNSSLVTSATILAQFKSNTGSFFPSASCLVFDSAAAVPANTPCYLVVTLSNGSQVGSLLTIQGTYNWTPATAITGFLSTALSSGVALTIDN
jgi:Flp pilus assembly protein TadG